MSEEERKFLEIVDLKKGFGSGETRQEVLRGMNFSVAKGEFCVLLGPSGSGKSTLLNIIGGIDQADSGYISINGDKLEDMNNYLIKNFRLAFGNRIMKQVSDFVPCYIACGGTEIQAVDFIVSKKVLRKFESLSLSFMKDELSKFSAFLDKTFGKNQMAQCKDYIEYLKRSN